MGSRTGCRARPSARPARARRPTPRSTNDARGARAAASSRRSGLMRGRRYISARSLRAARGWRGAGPLELPFPRGWTTSACSSSTRRAPARAAALAAAAALGAPLTVATLAPREPRTARCVVHTADAPRQARARTAAERELAKARAALGARAAATHFVVLRPRRDDDVAVWAAGAGCTTAAARGAGARSSGCDPATSSRARSPAPAWMCGSWPDRPEEPPRGSQPGVSRTEAAPRRRRPGRAPPSSVSEPAGMLLRAAATTISASRAFTGVGTSWQAAEQDDSRR